MKKRKTWVLAGTLLLVVFGGVSYSLHTFYQPLLFAVGDQVMRQGDWDRLKPDLFAGAPYTRSDDIQMLERRAMEELVLAKAKQMGVVYDENTLHQQLSQFGDTPEERAQQLAEMNTTEAKVRTNYERALTAFALKEQMTRDVAVSDQEINSYYEQNKAAFLAPEFRSVYYLRGQVKDTELAEALQHATSATFPELVNTWNEESQNRRGAWHELDGMEHLSSHTTPLIAQQAFGAELQKVIGPVQDGGWNYWYMISEIKPPHQFTLMEERTKIQTTLLQDKQLAQYREWLQAQKDEVGYAVYPENLDREPWFAFWHDLPKNLQQWF